MSQWEYFLRLFFIPFSLCASCFFGQRQFEAALHHRQEFQQGFLGLLWNTYLDIWSIEWPWTGQEYPLECVIWWDGASVNCSAQSLGMFLWRQTAWSCRQASVSGLEFYRNMCVHCTGTSNMCVHCTGTSNMCVHCTGTSNTSGNSSD